MEINKIAVIGAGQMGRGIAHVAALGGYNVVLRSLTKETLAKAVAEITKNLKAGVQRGKITQDAAQSALARIHTTTNLETAGREAQFVIEAIPEDIKIRWEVFKKLDEICPAETILATNTSSLSITEIFSVTNRTDRTIGMHFFIPAHIMRLVEIVKGLETSEKTAAITKEVGERMGKETVTINEAPGFVTSRINVLIGNEAFRMLQEGVTSARDIDKALKLGLNHPIGPFEMGDMIGLDTRLRVLEYLHETLGERFRPNPLLVKYVKAGRLGQKTGKGVYDYSQANKE